MRVAVLVLFVVTVATAQEVRWLGPEPARIVVGSKVILRLVAPGNPGDATLLPLPISPEFDLSVGRPELAPSSVDGAASQPSAPTTQWTITAVPRRAGRQTIARVSVDVAGKTIVAPAVSFDVERDDAAASRASIETILPRKNFVVGDTVSVKVRFTYEAQFFAENVILLFQRPIGIEAMLDLPFFGEMSALIPDEVTAPSPPGKKTSEIVVNGKAIVGEISAIERDQKKFGVIEIEKRFRAATGGKVVLAAPLARFAYASRFFDDFLNGRTPADRTLGCVFGDVHEISIRNLPTENRPIDFSGAVGEFSITASVAEKDLRAGRSFRVRLDVTGDGDFSNFAAPTFPKAEGLTVVGTLEEKSPGARVVAYEVIVDRGGAIEIPPIPFSYFDPREGAGYRTISSAAIPLVLSGTSAATDETSIMDDRIAVDLKDLTALIEAKSPRRGGESGVFLPIVCLLLPWAFAAFLRNARRRAREVRRPELRIDTSGFLRECDDAKIDRHEIFVRRLAHRLAVPQAAVVGPDARTILISFGVADGTADGVARALRDGLAERYGGPAGPPAAELAVLLDRLDREIATREAAR